MSCFISSRGFRYFSTTSTAMIPASKRGLMADGVRFSRFIASSYGIALVRSSASKIRSFALCFFLPASSASSSSTPLPTRVRILRLGASLTFCFTGRTVFNA